MKYEHRAMPEPSKIPPAPGAFAHMTLSDRSRDAGRGSVTPQRLAAILAAADQGDTAELCRLGETILERNWDVAAAFEQRAQTLTGVPWEIAPGDSGDVSKEAAEAFGEELRACGSADGSGTFQDLLAHLETAAVFPFAAAEIVWEPGGGLSCFRPVSASRFTLRNSLRPRLTTEERPDGMELPPDKFVVHALRRSGDLARGGLIRPLAWLHVFQNWPLKDLMSYAERFGMPFVVAKVDKKTWDEERATMRRLIRSFGPSGGGVFTRDTEVQLLQAASAGGDNVYFAILRYAGDAIRTLLLGQTATSGDASGLSGGDAQTKVRQDILEADCRALESTLSAAIAAPWTRFRFGGAAAAPRIVFKPEPPEDLANLANVVASLAGAGFRADPDELSARFGLKLSAAEPIRLQSGFQSGFQGDSYAMSARPDADSARKRELARAEAEWLGPVADELAALTSETEIGDAEFGRRLEALASGSKIGSSHAWERALEESVYDAMAKGAVS